MKYYNYDVPALSSTIMNTGNSIETKVLIDQMQVEEEDKMNLFIKELGIHDIKIG